MMFGGLLKSSGKYAYRVLKDEISFTNQFHSALVKKLQKKSANEFLRLQISSGQGCEGYTYKFRFDNKIEDSDYALIDSARDKILFAVNNQQMQLLKGSMLDYISQMMKQSFFVKENPNAELSCSCKTSFSPKESVL